jgi:hypothetical protein
MYFRVNYYIPDAENSDGFEDSQDFYIVADNEGAAEDALYAQEPDAAGVTMEEISENEYRDAIEVE